MWKARATIGLQALYCTVIGGCGLAGAAFGLEEATKKEWNIGLSTPQTVARQALKISMHVTGGTVVGMAVGVLSPVVFPALLYTYREDIKVQVQKYRSN